MDLEELSTRLEIQQVLYRYCRGVDRRDPALIASVYHDDAVDQHGAWEGLGRPFAEHLVPKMDQAAPVGQHHVTNALIEVRGGAADVESYFIALHPEAEGGHALVCGRYLDLFERRAGVWRIARRRVVIDLSRSLGAAEPWPAAGAFPVGGRREADPSAALFGSQAGALAKPTAAPASA